MGQKINPISLRIPIHRKMDSFWFDEKNYRNKFFQDIFIRKYIESVFSVLKRYPTKLIIRHFPHKISLYGFFLPWQNFTRGFRYNIQKQRFNFSVKRKIRKNKIKSSFYNYYQTNPEFLLYFAGSAGFLHNQSTFFLDSIKKNKNILKNTLLTKILIQEKLNLYNLGKNFSKNLNLIDKINLTENINTKIINTHSLDLDKLNLLFLRKKYQFPFMSVKFQLYWLILQLWKFQT